MDIISKKCTKCNIEKQLTEFTPTKTGLYNVYSICRVCKALSYKKRRTGIREGTILIKPKTEKYCPTCKETKLVSEFLKQRGASDGIDSYCKQCKYEANKQKCENNKKRKKIAVPLTKFCPVCKLTKNCTEFQKASRRGDGLQGVCARCTSITGKEYSTVRNKNYNRKYKQDPVFRLTKNLKLRLRNALKGGMKTKRTLELLGCTGEECMDYLETLFWPGMTRENMKRCGWHVDHIIPIVEFDLSKSEDQRRCFHYTNLQPLWAHDNISKNDRLDWTPAESSFEKPERLKLPPSIPPSRLPESDPPASQA